MHLPSRDRFHARATARCAALVLAAATASLAAQDPVLIFSSGYEPDVTSNNPVDFTDLTGTDQVTGYDWVSDLDESPGLGSWFVEYTGGNSSQRYARIIDEPGNTSNKVMTFWIQDPNANNGNGRVQASLYNNENLYEFTMRNRVYLHPDLNILQGLSEDFSFFTLFEFWNNPNWLNDPHPFRISVNMTKDTGVGEPFTFKIESQQDLGSSAWEDVWEFHSDWEMPIAQWVDIEIYFKEGDADNGRFVMKVTPDGGTEQTIFDLTEVTHHPSDTEPDGLTHFNPQKVYTSADRVTRVRDGGGVLQVYWDDFELWRHDLQNGGGDPNQLSLNTEVGDGADTRIIGMGSNREFVNDGGNNKIELRRQDWTGALFVGYLRFDLSGVDRTIEDAVLDLTIFDDHTATGPLNLYGLNDGYTGGADGVGEAEVGQNWVEGTGNFSNASGTDQLRGDTAPAFNEDSGTLSSEAVLLETITLNGGAKDAVITFADPAIRNFLAQDTDGLVTFIVEAGWTNGAIMSVLTKEGSSSGAPTLQLTLEAEGWAGYNFVEENTVDTGGWLGRLVIDPAAPWVEHEESGYLLYMPESYVSPEGAWNFIPKIED